MYEDSTNNNSQDSGDQQNYQEQQQQLMKQLEAEKQINALLRRLLDTNARERLKNIRLVNQDLYYKAVQQIVSLARAGRITQPINDSQLKNILLNLKEKKQTRIIRK